MNRNQQLFLNVCPVDPVSEAYIETISLVGGKVSFDRKSVKDHYAQYDPKAFSLQTIYENGLIDDLRETSPLEGDPLSVLDSASRAVRSSKFVNDPEGSNVES